MRISGHSWLKSGSKADSIRAVEGNGPYLPELYFGIVRCGKIRGRALWGVIVRTRDPAMKIFHGTGPHLINSVTGTRSD